MVKTGSSYCSQSELPVTFGLGDRTAIKSIEVTWPTGQKETITGARADEALTIEEGKGVVAHVPFAAGNLMTRAMIGRSSSPLHSGSPGGSRRSGLAHGPGRSSPAVRSRRAARDREAAYRAVNIGVARLEQYDFDAAAASFQDALRMAPDLGARASGPRSRPVLRRQAGRCPGRSGGRRRHG